MKSEADRYYRFEKSTTRFGAIRTTTSISMAITKSDSHAEETADKAALLASLLAWYDRHRRDLPWRAAVGGSPDPYHVLVSELMLQQTTVATVRGRFGAFIERFPDFQTLAAASEAEVMHAWQGLGYYRRARALHACAQAVVSDLGGRLPNDLEGLLTLPGIGAYTAKAIAAIAFGQPVVPVDGNVMRVLARLFRVEIALPGAASVLRAHASWFEPCPRPADVAQALMDLGATICRPKRPDCQRCPWEGACVAARAGVAAALPRREPKAARPVRQGVAFLLSRPDGAIFFRRRPPKGLLGGLHELPSSPWEEGPLNRIEALKSAPLEADWQFVDGKVRHVFTHFTLELDLAKATTDQPPDGLWQPPRALDQLALPTLMKKLLLHGGRL
ncbi:MAG: A/G-specific adenine glycosylase [Geminicoccaceae bacterium]